MSTILADDVDVTRFDLGGWSDEWGARLHAARTNGRWAIYYRPDKGHSFPCTVEQQPEGVDLLDVLTRARTIRDVHLQYEALR